MNTERLTKKEVDKVIDVVYNTLKAQDKRPGVRSLVYGGLVEFGVDRRVAYDLTSRLCKGNKIQYGAKMLDVASITVLTYMNGVK